MDSELEKAFASLQKGVNDYKILYNHVFGGEDFTKERIFFLLTKDE